MKILALGGAGHIGSGGVRELVKKAPDIEVIIADYHLDKAQMLAAEVGGKTTATKVDANDMDHLVKAMQQADVVLNTVGPYYIYGERIVKAAIEAKRHLVDVCDDGDATEKILALDGEARKAGVCVIVGLGATPGITNLMARSGADKLDRVDAIDTAWAWTAIDPKMTGSGIVEHYFHAIDGDIITYRDGQWVPIPAMSVVKTFNFIDPIGTFEVSQVGHPEPITLPRYIKGVRDVTNYGGIWPTKFSEMAKVFKEIGLSKTTEIEVRGRSIAARAVGTDIILGLPMLSEDFVQSLIDTVVTEYGEFGIEGVVLRVDVHGEKNGSPVHFSYNCGSNADLLTSLPSVLGALMLARGEIKTSGVFAPEGVVDPKVFFRELIKDIPVREISDAPIGV